MPASTRDNLGQRIRQLRLEKDWTQQQLAGESGLQRTYIAQLEQGRMNVTLDNLAKLADALGTEMVHLFDFKRRIEYLENLNKQWAVAWSEKVGEQVEVHLSVGPHDIKIRGLAPPPDKSSRTTES